MKLSIIVAMARDRAIGRDNDLLWRLPKDLKRFRALTTGHTILMGRKTWESLPNGALPDRRNVVVSRHLSVLPGAEVYASIEAALAAVAADEEIFVIGGGQLYRDMLPMVSRIYLTEVEAEYPDADTYFPELVREEWEIVCSECVPSDERNPLESKFSILERRKT